jgi:inhibitor of cysteine peptidase
VETIDVRGTAGVPIELPIGPGPATGHQWTLELPAGVRRIDDSEPVATGQLGDPPGSRIRVIATPGEHVIDARLARPWEANPVREVRLRLHVDAP